jgi:hypothetical protein
VDPLEQQKQRDAALLVAARATWEDLAARARGVHCPDHVASPWRVVVVGETRDKMRLQIYGCCERLGQAVTEMVRADPRISGPH